MYIVGFDTETRLIKAQCLTPRIVCLAMYCHGEADLSDHDQAEEMLHGMLSAGDEYHLVGHFSAFDLATMVANFPGLTTLVFDSLAQGRISCTGIRERLLNLAMSGSIDYLAMPDGSNSKVSYSLAALVNQYLGIDISAEKKAEDAWRLQYAELEDVPLADWPQEAVEYVIDDAKYPALIYELQQQKAEAFRKETGIDPFTVEPMRVSCDFALYLMSAWGIRIDAAAHREIEKIVRDAVSFERLPHLIESGILIPATPDRPHKNGARNHVKGCSKKECDCPMKMVKGSPEKINQKKLKKYVEDLCKRKSFDPKRTDPSDRFPDGQISVDSDWLEENAYLDPLLEEYLARQKVQKIITTELPRMLDADGNPSPVVHPSYDVLKRTGRTSSFASKLYPSFNCQNVDPRVRHCYIPRDGYLFFSIDYAAMELGTLGQTCLGLFGKSVLADKINAGIDPHAYLGSQLCYHLDDQFREQCKELSISGADEIFSAFRGLADADWSELQDIYKRFRKLAKPTGLGYPGGLMPATFCAYAKGTFGIDVDEKLAEDLREIWLRTYPEMNDYFSFIREKCVDPRHPGEYAYLSPLGLYRSGASLTAAQNGLALQTPSAEGALLAVWNLVRACLDPSLGSILLDDEHGPRMRPILFIHDEIVGEVRMDGASEWIVVAQEIMDDSMRVITPDVTPRTSAALMQRWSKAAESIYDDRGKLVVWSENDAYQAA